MKVNLITFKQYLKMYQFSGYFERIQEELLTLIINDDYSTVGTIPESDAPISNVPQFEYCPELLSQFLELATQLGSTPSNLMQFQFDKFIGKAASIALNKPKVRKLKPIFDNHSICRKIKVI